MANLPPVPHHAQVLDFNGFMTPVWADWFQKVFIRAGGNIALSNDELANVTTDRIVDSAVTSAKIDTSIAGVGLTGGSGSPLAVNPDGVSLELNSDQVQVKNGGITTPKVLDSAITFAKLLSTDWTSSLGAAGFQKLPSGLYVQWGVTASLGTGTTTTTNFAATFPTACFQVFASLRNNSAVLTTATGQWGTGNYTTSAFDLYNRTSVSQTFNWFAIGN